jgi:hypothetical protein
LFCATAEYRLRPHSSQKVFFDANLPGEHVEQLELAAELIFPDEH